VSDRGIRIVLADDHAIVLEGLRALVDGEADMQVVGSTTRGEEVVELVTRLTPEVVVLDYELGGLRATDIIGALRAHAFYLYKNVRGRSWLTTCERHAKRRCNAATAQLPCSATLSD